MKAIKVGTIHVIECPHCRGSGSCRQYVRTNIGTSTGKTMSKCNHCGEVEVGSLLCKVCNGKGFLKP